MKQFRLVGHLPVECCGIVRHMELQIVKQIQDRFITSEALQDSWASGTINSEALQEF